VRYLLFSERCCRTVESSGMWRLVAGWDERKATPLKALQYSMWPTGLIPAASDKCFHMLVV
jgi:hypothetical protein